MEPNEQCRGLPVNTYYWNPVTGAWEKGGDLSSNWAVKYLPCNQDDAGDPSYYGYMDRDGNWYIVKEDEAAGLTQYAAGTSGYVAAWAGRAGLTYGYPNEVDL